MSGEEQELSNPTDSGVQSERTEPSIPTEVPVVPVRDIVVHPYMVIPLFISRQLSVSAVDASLANKRFILIVTQKDESIEEPKPEDVYNVGAVCLIIRMFKLPDGRVRLWAQGVDRARIKRFVATSPYWRAEIERFAVPKEVKDPLLAEALIRSTKEKLERSVSLGKAMAPEAAVVAMNSGDPGQLADMVAGSISIKVPDAQKVLEMADPIERLRFVNSLFAKEMEIIEIQEKIRSEAQQGIEKDQQEYLLRQQMKAIREKLGDADSISGEVLELRKTLAETGMPDESRKACETQINRLEMTNTESAESTVIRTYIDWLLNLPWEVETSDNLDLAVAQGILDEDHYDLDEVKERVLEFLAVRKLTKANKGPILCFVGPPGTGKTSLGRSIARALGRKFVRISLGGVRDEAEVRGHRRTYVGALPGHILQELRNAGSRNPVFMMDEVDKIGTDFRGDPSSALLEVLDPEQNYSFKDHYIEIPFDLSNVLFICTANVLDTIQPAFRDRMEILRLSGYTEHDKISIARKFLIPKQLKENGLLDAQLRITTPALRHIVLQYTREAGLRNLERHISRICRKVARRIGGGETGQFMVKVQNLEGWIGVPSYIVSRSLKRDQVGVACALAWTATGGDVLFIEVATMPGSGQLLLTGQLGDVMKESAQAARSIARSRADEFGLPADFHSKMDIHIHVPAGAIPKDGPSAGVTIAVAVISALTKKPVRANVAMTGEITLRGNILPIGGLKEKVLAAQRAGITEVLLPAENQKEFSEIEDKIKAGLKFHFVTHIEEALNMAFTDSPRFTTPSPRPAMPSDG
ncbi:MAG TPA: endopeptidase La [bacterium]|nr:endopeptidase La [bacterium]